MVEVLISGGGPSGAVAALCLARQGVRVLVVERTRFPRSKLCGDTLNPGAMACLRALGLADVVGRAGLPLTGMIVEGEGLSVAADYPAGLSGLAITRRELDARLLDAAAAAGAQVQSGVRVIEPLLDDEQPAPSVRGTVVDVGGRRVRIPALVTIAADGRRSPLAFALGLSRYPSSPRRWAIGGYFENVDGLGTRGEMHVRRGHYVGVASVPGGLANACLVSPADRRMRDPEGVLRRAVEADTVLGPRFARARLVSPVVSLGPLAVDARGAGAPGLLLAGDAAGFVDPMTGDGLRLAIRGGVLAADVAMAMLEQPHLAGHVRLAELRRTEFGRKLRLNRVLRRLVAHPAGLRAGALAAQLAPGAIRYLIAMAGDVDAALREATASPVGGAP